MTLLTRRAALAALALVVTAVATTAQAAPSDTLRIGYQKSSTLITILKANGGLEKALAPLGVKVTWHEFTSGLPQLEALNIGGIDFSADVADTVPIFAQAAGAQLAFVAEEAPSPHAQAILIPANSTIKTLADLKGKRIAVTKGSGGHYLLLSALHSAGLTFKDITPAYLTPADGTAALVSGDVDALVIWDPFYTTAVQKEGAKLLADSEGLASYKRYYLAAAGYADQRSDVLKTVYDKLDETGKWVKANPRQAAQLLAGIWHVDPAIAREAIDHRSYKVGPVTKSGLAEQQKIADAFFAEGLIPVKVGATEVKIWSPPGS